MRRCAGLLLQGQDQHQQIPDSKSNQGWGHNLRAILPRNQVGLQGELFMQPYPRTSCQRCMATGNDWRHLNGVSRAALHRPICQCCRHMVSLLAADAERLVARTVHDGLFVK